MVAGTRRGGVDGASGNTPGGVASTSARGAPVSVRPPQRRRARGVRPGETPDGHRPPGRAHAWRRRRTTVGPRLAYTGDYDSCRPVRKAGPTRAGIDPAARTRARQAARQLMGVCAARPVLRVLVPPAVVVDRAAGCRRPRTGLR